jgi:hypothetical protein
MEIATASKIPGVPSKPLDNPAKPKPGYASDEQRAVLLERLVRRVPADLRGTSGSAFPLLDALASSDSVRGAHLARQLIFVAALNHRTADERRTAEYLLRNREAIACGERSAMSLLLAARCAAEMDVRRVRSRERPAPMERLSSPALVSNLTGETSVGEMVLAKLRHAIGDHLIGPLIAERVLDAVAIALALSERHGLNGGENPSLLGMRTDARPESRLVTHLRRQFGNDVVARNLARLLVGPHGTEIHSALLWWCALPTLAGPVIPKAVRARWVRYVRAADAALITPLIEAS